MNAQVTAPKDHSPRVMIDNLIAEHGRWRTLQATVLALFRRPGSPAVRVGLHDLPDSLRRDIGLQPLPPRQPDWPLGR